MVFCLFLKVHSSFSCIFRCEASLLVGLSVCTCGGVSVLKCYLFYLEMALVYKYYNFFKIKESNLYKCQNVNLWYKGICQKFYVLCFYAFYNFMLKISKCKIHQTIQYVRMCPCVHVSMSSWVREFVSPCVCLSVCLCVCASVSSCVCVSISIPFRVGIKININVRKVFKKLLMFCLIICLTSNFSGF